MKTYKLKDKYVGKIISTRTPRGTMFDLNATKELTQRELEFYYGWDCFKPYIEVTETPVLEYTGVEHKVKKQRRPSDDEHEI